MVGDEDIKREHQSQKTNSARDNNASIHAHVSKDLFVKQFLLSKIVFNQLLNMIHPN